MKQKATNSMDHFKRNVTTLGLCLMFVAGSISISTAQRVSNSTSYDNAPGFNERNPSTNPIRNITVTPFCPAINSIQMVDMGFDKVLVDWTNMANFDSILFRVTNLSDHSITTISIDGNPNPGRYFIQGLTAVTTYEIEVSTICNTGIQSSWSSPITVTTLQPRLAFGNDSQQRNTNRLTINPNPASTSTIIAFLVTGHGQQNVSITSTTGQEMMKTSVFPNVDKIEMVVDVSNYPAGIYVVKVSNSSGISVERLIVH